MFILMVAVTIFGFTQIEGQVAVHFGLEGQPDSYMGEVAGLLFLPVLAVFMFLFFRYMPRFDPLGENYQSFRGVYRGLAVAVTGLLVYVQILLIAWNIGFRFDMARFVIPVLAVAYYAAGIVMEKSGRNWFVGLRTPWTLSSDEVWDRTHRKVAPWMKASGILALTALLVPEYAILILIVPVLVVAVVGAIYSYVVFRDLSTGD